MAKKRDKIQIIFCGENSADVTGSCIWIKTPNKQILLELGLYQSCGSTLESYKINNKHFDFKPKDIDYLFIAHSHADHLCRAPLLYKRGGHAQILAPNGTKLLAEILLRDSANIMRCDAEELSLKFNRDYMPIYNESDVNECLKHYTEYSIGEMIQLDDNIKFRFVPSGHILNSAQLELWITEGNITKKIAYTSDLGNVHIKKYFTNNFQKIDKADIFIGESTYAHEDKIADNKMRIKDLEKLETAIRQTCIEERGRVLIPVFAQDRAQNMLTYIYDIFSQDSSFNIPILVDSPMAKNMCQTYLDLLDGDDAKKWKDVISWSNVTFVGDYIESREWRDSNLPVVVLSSSGMLVKGRSTAWACKIVPRENDRIITCGYAAEGSIASIIKEGKQKTITISGKRVKNKCQVTNLYSFSSHMQKDSLLSYYGSIQAEKIILVHGEMNGKIEFSKELQDALSKNNLTSKVICSNKDYSIMI